MRDIGALHQGDAVARDCAGTAPVLRRYCEGVTNHKNPHVAVFVSPAGRRQFFPEKRLFFSAHISA